jgi:hypothetical protein
LPCCSIWSALNNSEPCPEEQRDEYRGGVHSGDAAGHPGGDEGADERGDRQRSTGGQQRHRQAVELHEGGHADGGGSKRRTEVGNDVQQACGHGPGAGVLETDPAQCEPGKQRHQHIGRQEHGHVALDRGVDVIEDANGDLPVRQRRTRESHQLPLVGVAGQQEKESQEEHHRCLADQSHGADGVGPQEVAEFEAGGVDDDARAGRRAFESIPAAWLVAFSISLAAVCTFCMVLVSPLRTLARPVDNLLTAAGT